MTEKRNILFYGELPGKFFHGISISNEINLNMLSPSFSIEKIIEYSDISGHNRITFRKLLLFIVNNIKISFKSISKHYTYFYTIFSLTSFGSLKTLAAIISFRVFNKGRVILHIHRGDFFTRYYKNQFNKIITRLIFRLSHKVLLLSNNQKDIFEDTFKRSFEVLPNTIEHEFVPDLNIKQKNKFLFISNYLIDKGIIDLLAVFKHLSKHYKGLTLNTYGEFSDYKLKDEILGYESSQIHISGPILGLEKFIEISKADCLILPSWNEGQPVVLLEAMSVGTPVIASQTGLIPDLLGKDYPYLIIPKNKKSLEEIIIRFIKAENLQELSESLVNRYNEYYSREAHQKRLNAIFI